MAEVVGIEIVQHLAAEDFTPPAGVFYAIVEMQFGGPQNALGSGTLRGGERKGRAVVDRAETAGGSLEMKAQLHRGMAVDLSSGYDIGSRGLAKRGQWVVVELNFNAVQRSR